MPSEQNIFQPDSRLARAAHVSSFEQYQEMYKQSIEHPELFWGDISKQFHWETPADSSNFMNFNFDISKGPISIKWMEGASTNICYNLLDRNIKNGHGDKVAFFWYVLVFNLSVGGELWKCSARSFSWRVGRRKSLNWFSFPPTRQYFSSLNRRGKIVMQSLCAEILNCLKGKFVVTRTELTSNNRNSWFFKKSSAH